MLKCRICFSNEGDFINIFAKECESTPAHMFTECSGIQVSNYILIL